MEKTLAAFMARNVVLQDQAEDRAEVMTGIFDRYYKRIYNYMHYRLGNHEETEELTSQVFEQVLLKVKTYDPARAPFEVWLFTIARNAVTDYFRKRKRRQCLSLDNIRHLVSRRPDPEETALKNEDRSRLLQALDSLDERERNIIAMKFAWGLKNREIADLTGLSESHVGVLIYRSLHRLRVKLEDKG